MKIIIYRLELNVTLKSTSICFLYKLLYSFLNQICLSFFIIKVIEIIFVYHFHIIYLQL